MIQADNLDFTNISKVINHPLPLLNGDGANKDYCSPKLNLYYAEYVLPIGSSVSISTSTITGMTGFSVPTSPLRNFIRYKVFLSLRLTTTTVNNTVVVSFVKQPSNTGVSIRRFLLTTIGIPYCFDVEFWYNAGFGETLNVEWGSLGVGSTATNSSVSNQLSSFSITGFPNSLFSLT